MHHWMIQATLLASVVEHLISAEIILPTGANRCKRSIDLVLASSDRLIKATRSLEHLLPVLDLF